MTTIGATKPVTDIDKLVIYRRSDDRELIPLVSPTTQIGANATSLAGPFSVGFDFHFDGYTYSTCFVSARGFVRLYGTESSATNANLFASNSNVILAPWWDDLETADTVGYVKTEQQGTAPWRRFIVEWYCNLQSGQTGTDYDRARFQVVFYETTDRVEFRYGDIETGGSPSRASYSASCGIKGDTGTTTDNYRDCAVENRTLGGSKTTSTSTLAAPTDWPAYTLCIEPAWPMCGRAYLLDVQQLGSLQDRYADPAWRIANFVNWLYCKHCPPLVNFSPWQESGLGDVTYVVPVSPSPDHLTYDVYVQTYTSGGGDLTITVEEDIGAGADPNNDALWDNATIEGVTGSASGWVEWPVFQFTPQTDTEFLRFIVEVATGTVIVGSILMVPRPLDDIDETATPASGALPMSIAQLRQEGAAIHPEWFNRAWSSIRAILRSRTQMVWSSVWRYGLGIQGTTARPRRRVAIAPASFDGWPGQEVVVKVFGAADTSSEVTIEEIGSAAAVTFNTTLPATSTPLDSSDYDLVEDTLTLVSDQPVIVVEAAGHVYPGAVVLEWQPEIGDTELIKGVTPPPRLEYLMRLAARMERAMTAYAMTGIATALCRGKSTTNSTRVQYQVPPGVRALRARFVRTIADTGNSGDDTKIYGVSSGATANDQVVIAAPQAAGRDDYPPEGGHIVVNGALVYDASPAAAMDRLLESPTLGSMTGPVRERLDVVRGAGITVIPQRDLTV